MNDIIVAAPDGTELRSMLYSEYDFEIGDEENSFLVTMPRDEWEAKIHEIEHEILPRTIVKILKGEI